MKVIVVPTYNERANISALVPQLFEYNPGVHVLVVDDNSPDGTAAVVEDMAKRYPHLKVLKRKGKEGLGKAYIHAFKEVIKDPTVDTVVMMDADFSHNPKYLPAMFKMAEDPNVDVVIGSRYVKGGGTSGWELWRRILSKGGNTYCRLITRMPIHDCTGGFNVMKADILRKVDFDKADQKGYAFIMALKYGLRRAGARFAEFPIMFANRKEGTSKMSGNIIKEGILAPWKMILNDHASKKLPVMRSAECIVCTGKIHEHYATKNRYKVIKCATCGILSLDPIPKPHEAAAVYDKDYFGGATKGHGYVDYDTDKKAMSDVFARHLDHIRSLMGHTGKLFDIGAATGFFMRMAREKGWEVYGIDVSDYASLVARKHGLDVATGVIADVRIAPSSIDLVTMWDVLEHVTDPTADLAKVNSLLKKGGMLAINTPDSGSFYSRLMGKRWHLLVPPEHIWYFNRDSLKKLLEKSGFEVVEMACIGKRFSVEYVISFLYRWQKLSFWKYLLGKVEHRAIGKLSVPINLRDNMYVLARKK